MESAKSRPHFLAALEHVSARLRQAQNTITGIGRRVAAQFQSLRDALRIHENDLQRALADFRDVIVVSKAKFGCHLLFALEQVTVLLPQPQSTIPKVRGSVTLEARKGRPTTKENTLKKLLARSEEAIVVTEVNHRFAAANPKALDLFGVTDANLTKFSIDAFLPRGQILYFDANGSRFTKKRSEKHGRCEIRRLDGSLRLAEYDFVANFVPFRHLCRFHHVTAINQTLTIYPEDVPRREKRAT